MLESPSSSAIAHAGGNRRRRQIDAGEAALRQMVRQRNQVGAIAAADFEHPASGDRGGLHAEEPGHRGQPVRMRLPSRQRAISDLIVGIIQTSCPRVCARSPHTNPGRYAP